MFLGGQEDPKELKTPLLLKHFHSCLFEKHPINSNYSFSGLPNEPQIVTTGEPRVYIFVLFGSFKNIAVISSYFKLPGLTIELQFSSIWISEKQ